MLAKIGRQFTILQKMNHKLYKSLLFNSSLITIQLLLFIFNSYLSNNNINRNMIYIPTHQNRFNDLNFIKLKPFFLQNVMNKYTIKI